MFVGAAVMCGLALLWSTALSHNTFSDPLAPSIGDVQLVNHTFSEDGTLIKGTVQIYYDDGVRGPQWGYVCKSTATKFTAAVVCRQLGYSDGNLNLQEAHSQENEVTDSRHIPRQTRSSEQYPSFAWLSDIHCKDNSKFSHILRCNYNVSSKDLNPCEHFNVSCNRQVPQPYDGQVRLCSPREFPNATQSKSFGVVQVYLRNDWGGVNQFNRNVPLGSYEADSICRQLGYTNAVTSFTMTVESAKTIRSLNFNACAIWINTANSWFNTENALKCKGSEDCFGCCFPYPSDKPCSSSKCSFIKDVVVKCEYDPRIAGDAKEGSAELCQFNTDHQLPSQACSGPADWKRTFKITIGVVGPLAFMFFVLIIAIVTRVYCVPRCCNRGGGHGGGEQQPLLRRQNDEN